MANVEAIDYNSIIDRVGKNLGIKQVNSYQRNTIRRDLFDTLFYLIGKTAPLKETYEVPLIKYIEPTDLYTAVASGVGTLNGVYKYKIGYKTYNWEGVGAVEVTETASNNASIGLSGMLESTEYPAGVIALIIYRTLANGDIFYRVGTVTEGVYTDSMLDAVLVTKNLMPTVAPAQGTLSLPTDFFVARDVRFFNSDSRIIASNELDEEEYIKWNPIVEEIESFSVQEPTSAPVVFYATEENFLYDRSIGYFFADSSPVVMKHKPLINGTVKVLYEQVPKDTLVLTDNPKIHYTFIAGIVAGATMAELARLIKDADSEVRLMALRSAYGIFNTKLQDVLGDLQAFTENKVDSTRLVPFGIMDSDMEMLRRSE